MSYKTFRPKPGTPKIHNFATFDIESNDWKNFEILGFYDGKNYKTFDNISDFFQYVFRRKYYGFRFYSHFGGKFDSLFILEELKTDDIIITDINGVLIQIDVGFDAYKNKNGATKYRNHIYFRDSYRLLPKKLKDILKTFNVEYQKGDFDFKNKRVNKDDKELQKYLKSDVIGLYQAIEKFTGIWQDLGGEIKLTLPSSTMDLFQRKYLPKHVEIKSYFDIDEKIRKAYYGGRVEVFKKEYSGNSLFYYDFNSLYPSVMYNEYYPTNKHFYINRPNYQNGDFGIFQIKTNIKNLNIPPLPVKSDNMLLFPSGNIEGWYCSPFLELLTEMNIPFEVTEGIYFEKQKIFENFVSDLYKLRQEHKKDALNFIAKIALNSLYGKFGQQINRKEFIKNPTDLDNLTCYNESIDLWYKEKRVYLNYCLPAISAFVTTYAQIKLYKAILTAGFENTWYCDTDSIFTTHQFETSDKLGDLKLEDTILQAIFISQKLYAYKNIDGKIKIKSKGFDSKELDFEYFRKALKYNFEDFHTSRNGLLGYKESLIRFDQILSVENKTKQLRIIDTKRGFFGNESYPFILKGGE